MSAELTTLILAIVLGPVFAVLVVLWRIEADRAYQRRLAVFHALMMYRRHWLSGEWIGALNLTLVEFHNFPQVLAAHETLLDKFSDGGWSTHDARRQRILLDTETAVCALLQHMATALRINLKGSDLRNRNFAPKGWSIDYVHDRQVRDALLQILNGQRAVRVDATPINAPINTPMSPPRPRTAAAPAPAPIAETQPTLPVDTP